MDDHCHPSPDSFLDEQVLINISKKVQFHIHYFKSSFPGQTRRSVVMGQDQFYIHHFKTSLPGKTRGNVIMGRIKTIMLEAHVPKNSWTRQPVKPRWLTYRNCDDLQGLSCRSAWTPFVCGCNLSQRCLLQLMSYRRRLWVVTVVLRIIQRSLYIHTSKLLFASSMPSLLQYVIVDLAWVLAVGKRGFDSLHWRAWFHPLLHSRHVIGLWLIWLLNVKWL